MSRPAAATQQKPEPRVRRARFAEEDLVSTFGEAMLAEARRLLGADAVDLTTTGRAIEAAPLYARLSSGHSPGRSPLVSPGTPCTGFPCTHGRWKGRGEGL